LSRKQRLEKFGAKSYFYRKANDLPPAESDDDSDLVDDVKVTV